MGENTFRRLPGGTGGGSTEKDSDPARETGRASGDGGTRSRPVGAGSWLGSAVAEPGGEASATYWKRRFVILAAGLAVFSLAAWTLSGALRVVPRRAGPAAYRQAAGITGSVTAGVSSSRPAAASGTAAGTGPDGAPSPGTSQASPLPGTAPSPGTRQPARGFAGFGQPFCARQSVVLSLVPTQAAYGPGQRPAFTLSIVSTQRGDCSFNIGPGHLSMVIKEGPTRIWSSADCVSGTASLVTVLRRGVPTVMPITWTRRTSAPGCGSPERAVPPGRYTAYAVDGPVTSGPSTFRLN